MTEMYSGLIPLDESNPDRALFFVFQPRVGDPVDEITFWTNGGPGCSSLEGFFQENGLIQWTWGQYAPQIQPYSWVNLTNMLWVSNIPQEKRTEDLELTVLLNTGRAARRYSTFSTN